MEIHKPGPVRSLREFLSEVAVVLLGIVIALSGERLLVGLEWRHKMRLVTDEMRQEISGDAGPQVLQRIALSPCIDQALDDIDAAVAKNMDRGAVREAIGRLVTPRHTWDNIAWQAAVSGGVLTQMPVDRVDSMSRFYSLMPVLESANEREFRDGAALAAPGRAAGPLGDAERMQLLQTVETLRRDNAEILRFALLARTAMNQLGVAIRDYRPLNGNDESSQDPRRVLRELEKLPMAQQCLMDLRRSLQSSQ